MPRPIMVRPCGAAARKRPPHQALPSRAAVAYFLHSGPAPACGRGCGGVQESGFRLRTQTVQPSFGGTSMSQKVLKMIKDKGVKFVDLRFTDTRGKEQ
ncbi:MAG TPA: hypothetical protein ENK20_02265, partial [Chromatiales bacterium]|nr:hypothetical protein [Chromatiales bacterium]